MISEVEFEEAFKKVNRKPGITLTDKFLARQFLINLGKRYASGENFDWALNDLASKLDVLDTRTRNSYKSLAGYYFGTRGGRKRARQVAKEKQKAVSTAGSDLNQKKQYYFAGF